MLTMDTETIIKNKRSAYQKQWYAEHKEQRSQYMHERYLKNKSTMNRQSKEWYHDNKSPSADKAYLKLTDVMKVLSSHKKDIGNLNYYLLREEIENTQKHVIEV